DYTVYLFIEDSVGCSGYFTTDIEVYPIPEISFTADPTVACSLPLTTTFTNTTTGAEPLSYLWNFGDGSTSTAVNPSHNYSTVGEFSVSLTAMDALGCTNTITQDSLIIINTTLNVDFVPSSTLVCSGESVSFTNLSDAVVGTWLWDFGDGTTSTAFEPTHVYSAPGTYTVSLSGDFGGGCTGAITYTSLINVIASPTVSFTSTDPTSFCSIPLVVSFTPEIIGVPSSLLWEFETPTGISTSTAIGPSFSWDTPGFYDVSLTVTNISGCTTEYSISDYVNIGIFEVTPEADPINGCIPLPVAFTAVSGAEITEYLWDFGDGSTSTDANPVHIYNTVGCNAVTIIAQTIDGCVDTTTIADLVCAGETGTSLLSVPDTACPAVNIGVYYLPLDSLTATIDGGLDFGFSSNVDSVTIINMDPGYHDLVFYTWINGCPDSVVSSIYILDVVDSTMVYEISCINPYQVQFYIDTALAAMSCGWVWDFGDGTEDSVSMNPVHTYAATGSYTVNVIYDCITETECSGEGLNILITDPISSFAFEGLACDTPYTLEFINTSTDGAGDALTYFWNFGDGTTSTEENPVHTFDDFGQYFIYLQVMDAKGCPASQLDTLVVNEVEAGFLLSDDLGCTPFTFSLFDNSTSMFGDLVSWTIDWSDGAIETFTSASEMTEV
ncbi:MAG: PKD domain-containing protein, partial [Chitinophagales bacterium]